MFEIVLLIYTILIYSNSTNMSYYYILNFQIWRKTFRKKNTYHVWITIVVHVTTDVVFRYAINAELTQNSTEIFMFHYESVDSIRNIKLIIVQFGKMILNTSTEFRHKKYRDSILFKCAAYSIFLHVQNLTTIILRDCSFTHLGNQYLCQVNILYEYAVYIHFHSL